MTGFDTPNQILVAWDLPRSPHKKAQQPLTQLKKSHSLGQTKPKSDALFYLERAVWPLQNFLSAFVCQWFHLSCAAELWTAPSLQLFLPASSFEWLSSSCQSLIHSRSSHFLRSILITSCRSLSRRHYLPGSLYNTLSPYEGSLSRLDPPVLNRELNQARNNCPSSDILYYNLTYCSCYQSNLIRDSFKSHLSGVTKDC